RYKLLYLVVVMAVFICAAATVLIALLRKLAHRSGGPALQCNLTTSQLRHRNADAAPRTMMPVGTVQGVTSFKGRIPTFSEPRTCSTKPWSDYFRLTRHALEYIPVCSGYS